MSSLRDAKMSVDLADGVLPTLERKPGGPDNWVEAAGGLPDYIEKIAKRLHYQRGFTIQHAIATAVNTVKRWAKGGTVTKYGTAKTISPATQAKAAAAVASWEAKKKAGSLKLSEEVWAEVNRLDLSTADVSSTDTMVALMLPQDLAEEIAVEGGTPVDELHVTLAFFGDLNDAQHDELVKSLQGLLADWQGQTEYKGTIGGIGAFPAMDPEKGPPWWVPVDIMGLTTLHDQILASVPDSINFEQTHGYTPHITLTYGKDAPEPVDSEEVAFNSVWVVRGNTQRTEILFGEKTSADEPGHATIGDSNVKTSGQRVDIKDLAERASKIEDPTARAEARAAILDLASTIAPKNRNGKTSDNRPSYKRQGKWGHGFVPLDKAAKEAKAKGSPIAMKRVSRLFGDNTRKSGGGRTGQRSDGGRKRMPDRIAINERKGSKESAKSLGQLRSSRFEDATHTERQTGGVSREASRQSRVPDRAVQNWDEIPSAAKTVRDGKRYVLAEYGGKQIITEWVGGVKDVEQSSLDERKVMRTITEADAMAMSAAALRKMLANPRTPDSLRKTLNKALRSKEGEDK